MKRLFKKTKNLIRGTSTAVLISAGLHIILLVAAASWVVFTVAQNQAAKFTPVQINRPKMNLQKLRVKVQESSKPRKSTERIVSRGRSSSLPDMKLPEMTGMGVGLERGIGGFEMMGDLSKMTIFGGGKSLGNDLEGTLYYLAWDRSGSSLSEYQPVDGQLNQNYAKTLNEFLASNWSVSVFDRFWRAPRKLYATFFMLPPFVSNMANDKFGLPADTIGASYLVHYKGKISSKTGGKFRFWGGADDLIFVRINGKLVLDGRTANADWTSAWKTPENWKSSDPENHKYYFGGTVSTVGDWFELQPGVSVEMEVLFGEDQGGRTSCMLNIQQFGVEYPKNRDGAPILPVFKTAPIPEHLIDELEYGLIEGESDLTNGPVFNAY